MKAIINHKAIDTWLEYHIGEYVEVIEVLGNILVFKIEGYEGENSYPMAFFDLIKESNDESI